MTRYENPLPAVGPLIDVPPVDGIQNAVRAQLVDPVRMAIPSRLAAQIVSACSADMDGCRWSGANVSAARGVLISPAAQVLRAALASAVGRHQCGPGWAVLAFGAHLSDEELQLAAAGVLAAIGTPFYSVQPAAAGWLWIGEETSTANDEMSFGGVGAQGLHIDAPNVEVTPDYTSLLVLRSDPAGGGVSLLGDLHAAVGLLAAEDRDLLAEPVFYEGRAQGLHGVGAARMPFPVLEFAPDGRVEWVRWAAKMLLDERNSDRVAVLQRFAAALARASMQVVLERGQLLIVDQQRIAHGRTALGSQRDLAAGTRRWILQAKASFDPSAPSQVGLRGDGGRP